MAQLVRHPTSAPVTISRLVGLSPASGSVLTAQSLEPASDSASPFLSPLESEKFTLRWLQINCHFFSFLFLIFFNVCLFLRETERHRV